jgi:hypothetical protein
MWASNREKEQNRYNKLFEEYRLCSEHTRNSHNFTVREHEESAGNGLSMNGDAILFHKNIRPLLQHYSYTQCTALLDSNAIEIGGVRMRSEILSPAPVSQWTSVGATVQWTQHKSELQLRHWKRGREDGNGGGGGGGNTTKCLY